MKYFLDTEFIEKPNTITLISIGIKCEDGRKLHLISNEYDASQASDWVLKNVLTPLYIETVHGDNRNINIIENFHYTYGKSIKQIKEEIKDFVYFVDEDPEFWGYYSDYDWVVFCWIFGKMIDLPKRFPMYCRDLKQSLDESGKESIPSPEGEHNALVDAIWNEKLYNHIFGNK